MICVRKALFGLTILAGVAVSSVALAQTSTSPPPGAAATAQASGDAAAGSDVVVTGSRIKRVTVYNSPSPITVITADQAQLTGVADTTALLQLSTVANNAVQINNNFTGFNVQGGAGINSLSLRGLGVQRTLILIDGQRMGPAGVGGTVDPVDLNTIPSSIIDHVEILNDGASSIYGSDAVAGVVNIITKKNFNGGDLHFYGNPSEHGGGDVFQVNGDWGKTFDRGYVSLGFDVYRQEALNYASRPYLACTRDVVVDATTGAPADIVDPTTGKAKCGNLFLSPGVESLVTGNLFAAAPGSPGGPGGAPPGFNEVGIITPGDPAATRASAGLIPFAPPAYLNSTAISPVTRYTFTAAGGFDLTPHAQLYGTVLINQRKSTQLAVTQFFTPVDPGNAFNPGFDFPLPVIPQYSLSTQTVNYYRFVGGIKGDLPPLWGFKNWTYDIYGQGSISDGSYTERFARNDRVNATAGSSNAAGCDVNANIGGGESMAEAEPGVACVPVDFFGAVQRGAFTPAEQAFLYVNESGHTTYNHYYVDGSATGDIFSLPAGPLSGAFGFQIRREELKDTPPIDFINQNAFNITTAGVTQGSETSEEIYGELHVPIIKDLPLIRRFDVDVSGRVSNYSNFGTNGTYKVGLNWQVTDWLTFRASDGTAFRAPALFEQFLADQSGFLAQMGLDPCIRYGTSGVSQTVQKNCASLGIPANFTGAQDGATVLTGGGKGLLPETSTAQTVGVVFQPTWFNLNLKVAANYFAFDIRNQIQNFGASNIVLQCMEAASFPNSPFCSLFTRNNDPTNAADFHGISVVNDDYVNVARQIEQGMDLDVTYVTPLPKDFKLTIDGHASWSFYTNTILLNGQTNNFLGQVGQPSFVGNVDFRVDQGPWTLNYFVYMVGPSSDYDFTSGIDPNYAGTGQAVRLRLRTGFYATSDIALRRKFDTFTVTLGVKNLFDALPPVYSFEGFQNRIGTFPLTSQYDLIGRTFFVDLVKKF
jgi:iron complex outermembrane receptor protein